MKQLDVMNVVDTNILVRLLTGDDARQFGLAESLFSSAIIWIAKTVLLETSRVLRSVYRYDHQAICDAFTGLFGLPNVQVEDAASVKAALALTAHGIDFADALHLTSRPDGAVFVTFDKRCVERAHRAGVPDVSEVRET